MQFSLTTEQEDLAAVLASYLDDRAPLATTRALLDDGIAFDRRTWKHLAVDLGLQGVDGPESLGGVGMTTVELSIVMHEAGARLYSGPLLASTGLALSLLLGLLERDEVIASLISEACDGTILAAATPSEYDEHYRWSRCSSSPMS